MGLLGDFDIASASLLIFAADRKIDNKDEVGTKMKKVRTEKKSL